MAEGLRWSVGSLRRAGGVRQPPVGRRAGAEAAAASVAFLVIAASFVPPAAEAASTPTLTMTPTAIVASTSGVGVALRYATPTRTATTVTLAVPPAWATLVLPQTSRSSRSGYASLGRTSCDATTRITSVTRSNAKTATITVNSSCAAKGTWTLTIHGMSAPRSLGVTTWTARVRTASGSWRSTSFSVRVGPGTLDVLLGRTVLPTDGTTRVPVYALARDAAARPLAGVPVRFVVGAGATIEPPVATTDRRGIATSYVVGATTPPSPTVTIVATAAPLSASATLAAASTGTLTVEAGAGGTVSPSGTVSYPLGSTVDVAITPTDPASVPGVMVDGAPVSPTPPVAPSTAWGVTVKITGANRVDVSFAKLAEMTRVADAASGSAFAGVAPGGTSIRFSVRTPFLDGLAVGDILSTSPAAAAAGMAPVLLRITGVDRTGLGVTFTTTPAQLTDALASASLDAHIPLVEQLPAATLPTTLPTTFGDPAPSLAAVQLAGSATVGGWGDALTSQVGPIAVTGAYQVSGPTLNLSASIGLTGVTVFRATVSETAKASISLDGSSKSSSTERTLAHHAFNGDIVLGAIVVPYVITVDAGAGVESQIGLAFHTKVGVSGTLETGVSYVAGSGWSLVANQDVTFPFDPPTVPAITGRVRGYPFLTVTPAIGFSYGVGPASISLFCGPYVKAEPGFLELGADTSANPWAWLDAGVSVSGGARCSFGDPVELGSVEVVRHRLWDSGGPMVAPTPTPPPAPSITTYAVGKEPQGLAFDGSNIWVANAGSGTVTKLVAATGGIIGTYRVGGAPVSLAFDGTNIWVANFASPGKVTKLDAATGSVLGTFAAGETLEGIALDGVNVWVSNAGSGTVTKLNAASGGVIGTYQVGVNPQGILFDGASIWVANYGSDTVTKLVAATGALVGTCRVGSQPFGLAFDGVNVWVSALSGTVTKLKADDGHFVGTYRAGTQPAGITFDGTNIWVADEVSGTVSKLVAATGQLVGSYAVGRLPLWVVFDGSRIWVSNTGTYGTNTVTRLDTAASSP